MSLMRKFIWFLGGIAALLTANWLAEKFFAPAKPVAPAAPVKLLTAHHTKMLAADAPTP